MTGPHFHTLRLSAAVPDADDALLLSFEVPGELQTAYRFAPGQYLTLRAMVDGQETRRSYSICAAPGEPLRVGVRLVPGGVFSSWLHTRARVGMSLEVMTPEGRFGAALTQARPSASRPSGLAPHPHTRHILAVAGGSGITPILSILKTLLQNEPEVRCSLIYANRRAASTMFKEELEDLKNRQLTRFAIHPLFSREVVDSPLHSGRLSAAKLTELLRLVGPVDEAYICGPHTMNDETEAALLVHGLAPARIHVERFGAPPGQDDIAATLRHLPGDAAVARLTLVRDGITRRVPFGAQDGSVLDAAARAGMDVPYSCKSGVCATCRAKLLHGQVRMARNFALEKSELEAGYVLTCQAHPLSAEVTLSFDER